MTSWLFVLLLVKVNRSLVRHVRSNLCKGAPGTWEEILQLCKVIGARVEKSQITILFYFFGLLHRNRKKEPLNTTLVLSDAAES